MESRGRRATVRRGRTPRSRAALEADRESPVGQHREALGIGLPGIARPSRPCSRIGGPATRGCATGVARRGRRGARSAPSSACGRPVRYRAARGSCASADNPATVSPPYVRLSSASEYPSAITDGEHHPGTAGAACATGTPMVARTVSRTASAFTMTIIAHPLRRLDPASPTGGAGSRPWERECTADYWRARASWNASDSSPTPTPTRDSGTPAPVPPKRRPRTAR